MLVGIEAFNDGKVGGVHWCGSASGGDAIEGCFEVVLVCSKLGGKAGVGLGLGSRGERRRAGGIIQLANVTGPEEVDARGDELVQCRSARSGRGRMAATTGCAMEQQNFKEKEEFPEGDRRRFSSRCGRGGMGRSRGKEQLDGVVEEGKELVIGVAGKA